MKATGAKLLAFLKGPKQFVIPSTSAPTAGANRRPNAHRFGVVPRTTNGHLGCMRRPFLSHIRAYTVRCSVTASAARGQRSPGLVQAARDHLLTVPLQRFGVASQPRFRSALDRETERFVLALPRRARHWGVARKLLNIYLRNALYTSYLSDAHGLRTAESWYELPLDRIVAVALRRTALWLPRWQGVKHLTPELNARYQDAARAVSAEYAVAPVHLDAMWWGGSREASPR